MTLPGQFSFVLHTHMPYVRRNGAWPVGEDWLYQAMSETYLPLLGMLAELDHEDLGPCLALTLTPVLCEQLADRYIQDRFVSYLKTMAERARGDARDFRYFSDTPRGDLAKDYEEDFKRKLLAYTSIGGDILGAIASFEEAGLVETLGSCATHAFLPGLGDEKRVREQVRLGVESHVVHIGKRPKGFWVPECAYRTGLEEILAEEGVEYFIVDSTALGGLAPGRPYTVGSSPVVALARSDRAHGNVWDEDAGYPTDGSYLDSTKYYHGSGLHYWRVTGREVDIEAKEVYVPADASRRALDHAEHFIGDVAAELDEAASAPGGGFDADPPLVVACYDTEFFGHGWKEGFYWLEIALRSLSGFSSLQLTVPSEFLARFAERAPVELAETSWGTGRDHSTWLNEGTRWMWEAVGASASRLSGLARRFEPAGTGPLEARALVQAAREVLLLESSDWPYMVAKDRAADYASERFRRHLERFESLCGALEDPEVKGAADDLDEVEEADNIFAGLDLRTVLGDKGPGGPRRETECG